MVVEVSNADCAANTSDRDREEDSNVLQSDMMQR